MKKLVQDIFGLVCFLISVVMALAAMIVVVMLPVIIGVGICVLFIDSVKALLQIL